MLHIRHFHSDHTAQLDGAGGMLPELDPERLRAVIEYHCFRFAASDSQTS